MVKILLIGPQGSGKSTQAEILAGKYGLLYIGMGNEMRKLAQESSDEGKVVAVALDSGNLVPNEIAVNVIKRLISSPHAKKGVVVDGYPRTIEQIELFDPGFDKVINLHIEDDTALQRLLQRGREDDTQELISQRLKKYHQRTEPILNYYRQLGRLIIINGEKTVAEVTAEIEKHLGEVGRDQYESVVMV